MSSANRLLLGSETSCRFPVRAVCGLLLGLALVYSFWGTIGKPDCQDCDFGSYYRAAGAVSRGESPYTVDEHGPMGVYPYAPAYAYLFMPLYALDYLWAVRCWLALNWLATAGVFWLSLRILSGDREAPGAWIVCVLAAVVMGAYIWADLRVGQIVMFMVLACSAWIYFQERGRPFLGGGLLAVACAMKLAPLVFVPYLLLRRDWRGLAGVAAGGAVLFLLPALWTGWQGTARLHADWVHHSLATQVPLQTYRPGNQSLLAQLARVPPISSGHVLYSEENLAVLSRLYPAIVALLGAALYGWICWDQRRKPGSEQGLEAAHVHLAFLFVFLTLAHPRAWRCNFVALIFPCMLLVSRICRGDPGARFGLGALALLLLAGVLPTDGVGEQGWSLAGWFILGKHFWGGIALALACCRCGASHIAK